MPLTYSLDPLTGALQCNDHGKGTVLCSLSVSMRSRARVCPRVPLPMIESYGCTIDLRPAEVGCRLSRNWTNSSAVACREGPSTTLTILLAGRIFFARNIIRASMWSLYRSPLPSIGNTQAGGTQQPAAGRLSKEGASTSKLQTRQGFILSASDIGIASCKWTRRAFTWSILFLYRTYTIEIPTACLPGFLVLCAHVSQKHS